MLDITLVLTSCGRFDLLDRTIESIGSSVISSLPNKIIIDDSGQESAKSYFDKYGDDWNIILNDKNIGQPKSVDKAYAQASTNYIFHCEDDWLFDPSFSTKVLEDCIDILEHDDRGLQVTFRKNSPHPTKPEILRTPSEVEYQVSVPGWRGEWFGFSYNPSVVRKSSYDSFGKYSGQREQDISKQYFHMGLLSFSLLDRFVSHIGCGRSTGSHLNI